MAEIRTSSIGVRLVVDPPQTLVDEGLSIRVIGCRPHQRVTVRAKMRDDLGRFWESYATFTTDAAGTVDASAQTPLDGTYRDADPFGLLWSLTLDPGEEPRWSVGLTSAPIKIALSAEVDGSIVAADDIERLVAAPGVTRTPVRDEGLVATFFRPAGGGPFPTVIVLGGSSGGLSERGAALFASRGFAGMALAYFRAEHLPQDLIEIPLEYFETAIRWLQRHPPVNADRLAVMGSSRGGELALLLGATFPDIKAVVGYVPSGLVHGGLAAGGQTSEPRAAWMYRGRAIPFVSRPGGRPSMDAVTSNEPLALTPIFLRMLEDRPAVEAATIPVERIHGPVLLISGQDDAMWPSPTLADIAMKRLAEHNHPHPSRHLTYPGAGHLISPPGLPATFTASQHALAGRLLAFGGNPKDTAAACMDAWRNVLVFLKESLGH